MVADPIPEPAAPVSPQDAAFYANQMCRELALMAERADLLGLAALLRAAQAEAARAAGRLAQSRAAEG